ncbi:antibiotic biosynthesis monooxygenase [Streptomyces sp. NPDC005931]|uniref:antibiotic biosynthesis monooxygenase n=1 Tax=Streptomyces sp. NPDC005931 TaxID=3364737 RepID=UPI0036B566C3
MSQRDRELTVVERFTTASASPVFERELLGYADYRESRKGCVLRVTAALTERPGAYVHLERWTGLDRLLRVVHQDPAAPAGPRGLAATIRTEAELLVSVGRMVLNGTPAEAARLVLVRAVVTGEPDRFELDFGSLVGQCVADDGFGGSDLLRSVADPCVYTGLLWWRDAAACDRARASEGYRGRRTELAATAHVTDEPARPLPDPEHP